MAFLPASFPPAWMRPLPNSISGLRPRLRVFRMRQVALGAWGRRSSVRGRGRRGVGFRPGASARGHGPGGGLLFPRSGRRRGRSLRGRGGNRFVLGTSCFKTVGGNLAPLPGLGRHGRLEQFRQLFSVAGLSRPFGACRAWSRVPGATLVPRSAPGWLVFWPLALMLAPGVMLAPGAGTHLLK